ncbi:MAG: cytidylate kinase-like family protein [Magnetococcales bacterium]|nr:cytidylate kinase-like family protein [Magnetococcales bacterium]
MKNDDALDKVQALIKSIGFQGSRTNGKREIASCGPVVTIARDFGAGGNAAGRILAGKIGVPCLDQELLDQIVERMKTDKKLMRRFDERLPQSFLEDWLYTMVTKGAPNRSVYHQRLIHLIQGVADMGGVILGRGAHLILDNRKNVFRMRITGSVEVCAKRIADREGVDLEKAKRMITQINQERMAFVRGLFKHFPSTKTYYDLVLNSDGLTPDQITEVALFTMKQMGFHVPERKTDNGRHLPSAKDSGIKHGQSAYQAA